MTPLALFALGVNALIVLALTGVFTNAGRLFGPRSVHRGDGDLPYEAGMPPLSPAHERMTVLYHRFAVLFVVFDVDLAFLLPWALNRPGLDAAAMAAITSFTAVVLFMLVYFWRKGALECR
jgi:NADH:ubiquinone oxidoreductase subunit 3 (subunit A)